MFACSAPSLRSGWATKSVVDCVRYTLNSVVDDRRRDVKLDELDKCWRVEGGRDLRGLVDVSHIEIGRASCRERVSQLV